MKILAVGAHLDDIEIACGGTLAKAVNKGHKVKALIMSKSSYRHLNGEIGRTEEVAVKEGMSALHTLGIDDVVILDYDTNEVKFEGREVTDIEKVINEFDPDIIFTHHPFDTHQSHEGTSKATIAAARRRRTIYFYEPSWPSGRSYVPFKPQLYVDITDTIHRKMIAIRKHETEYNKFGGEDYLESIKSRARVRGIEIMRGDAEAFEVLREELIL